MRTFRNKNDWKPLQSVFGVDLCSAFLLLTSATGVVVTGRPGWTPVFLCPPQSHDRAGGVAGKDPAFMLGTLDCWVCKACSRVERSCCAWLA